MDPACLSAGHTPLMIEYEAGQVEITLSGVLLEILVGGKVGSRARLPYLSLSPQLEEPRPGEQPTEMLPGSGPL